MRGCVRGGADRSEISQIRRPDWMSHQLLMMDGLWKGIALGCFLLAFSVLMGCVVRVGDWDILGVGGKV